MRDELKIQGHWSMKLLRNGLVVVEREGPNLVTALGKQVFASRIVADGSHAAPSHFGVGDGSTPPLDSQTTLQGVEHTRVALGAATRLLNTISYPATIPWAAAMITVREAGIFNAAAAGSMVARWLTQEFQMFSGDTLVVTWSLPIGGA